MPVKNQHLNIRLVGILRTKPGTPAKHAIQAIQTAFNVGAEAIEITSNSENWQEVVDACVKKDLNIGVGSVKTKELAEEAIEHGASFLVSPGFFEEAVIVAKEKNVPILPGVYLEEDLELVKKFQLKDVKFFPANVSTHEEFYKAVREPFRDEFEELQRLGIEILFYDPSRKYANAIFIDSPSRFYKTYLSIVSKSHKLQDTARQTLVLRLPEGDLGFDRLKEFSKRANEFGIHTYAVGGVNDKNMKEVLTKYNAYGVCVGSGIFSGDAIFSGDFERVRADVKRHVEVMDRLYY